VKAIDDESFEELATSLREYSWRAFDPDPKPKGKMSPPGGPKSSRKRPKGGSDKDMELEDDLESCVEDDGSGSDSSSADEESSV
jgi:hypothetical protein